MVELSLNEKAVICLLLEKEINNFMDVYQRTGRTTWLEQAQTLEALRDKLQPLEINAIPQL